MTWTRFLLDYTEDFVFIVHDLTSSEALCCFRRLSSSSASSGCSRKAYGKRVLAGWRYLLVVMLLRWCDASCTMSSSLTVFAV